MNCFTKAMLLMAVLPVHLKADPLVQSQISFTPGSMGTWNADWDGAADRTYFFQWSLDLVHWRYAPFIEFGPGIKSHGMSSSSDKYFIRLFMSEGNNVSTLQEAKDADYDGDGLSNLSEVLTHSTDPMRWDSDGDGLDDSWEITYGLNPNDDGSINPVNGSNGDPDGDGFSNLFEYWYGTNPHNADTDGDGINDGDEVNLYNTSPTSTDSDQDGLTDYDELFIYHTNPEFGDTDWDGLSDGVEIGNYGTNPLLWDTDGDGLNDKFEITYGFNPHLTTVTSTDTDGDDLDLLQEQSAGTDPNNADTDGDGISDSNELMGGTSPTNPDTDGDEVPDKFEITFKSRVSYTTLYKYGFDSFQVTTPPKKYLKQVESWTNMSGGNPESGPYGVGPGTRTRIYDPLIGSYTSESTGVGGSYGNTVTSPTTKNDSVTIYNYDDPPNETYDEPGTVTAAATLSDENTTAMMLANTNGKLPAYPPDFYNYGYAEADKAIDESHYSLRKMKYKLVFGGAIQASLKWVEMFSPENDPNTLQDESQDPTFTAKSWSGTGAETPEFEINPYTIDPAKDGRYEILYVEHVTVAYTDPNSHKIPSNQYANNVLGKEHIVCVKDTGDVRLQASFNYSIPDSAKNKVTWTCSGGTITSPAYGTDPSSKLTAKLSSAIAGKYPVVLSLDGIVMWEGVVWVIWADITSTHNPISPIVGGGGIDLSGRIDFVHSIAPVTIVTDSDHPNLEGGLPNAITAPPGMNSCGQSLANGANTKWDQSRQIKGKFTAPSSIVVQCVDNLNFQYPSSDILGNDDATVGAEETNNLYSHSGLITGYDNVSRTWYNYQGSDGDKLEHNIQFQEFTRILLGNTWYRCSDWYPWRVDLKLKKVSGAWVDDGSGIFLNNVAF